MKFEYDMKASIWHILSVLNVSFCFYVHFMLNRIPKDYLKCLFQSTFLVYIQEQKSKQLEIPSCVVSISKTFMIRDRTGTWDSFITLVTYVKLKWPHGYRQYIVIVLVNCTKRTTRLNRLAAQKTDYVQGFGFLCDLNVKWSKVLDFVYQNLFLLVTMERVIWMRVWILKRQ